MADKKRRKNFILGSPKFDAHTTLEKIVLKTLGPKSNVDTDETNFTMEFSIQFNSKAFMIRVLDTFNYMIVKKAITKEH